ncbi:MAG: hypothetical protein H0U53_08915 [Actinobacteria bacterium]|nr:hypothetical protein [Actinomycetota bacterium]
MKFKLFATITAGALIAGALFAPAAIAGKKAPKGPTVLGTDDAGDWGANVDATIGPVGAALGQDLTEASIAPSADKKGLDFVITLASLPPTGGTPEISRYSWDFTVDGEAVELDGKFTNFSRGTCDPTSGQCPPPRNPGLQPFFVRGNCAVVEGTAVVACEELGVVQAAFDAAKGTITIPVPLELIGAKKGSKIGPGVGLFGSTVEAAPAAFLTSGSFPSDGLLILKTYVVK